MENNTKKSLKQALPVYLVFIFLIAAAAYVIYSKKQAKLAQYYPIDTTEAADMSSQTAVSSTIVVTSDSSNKSKAKKPTLAQIIAGRRSWDAIYPNFYGKKAPDFTVKGLDGKNVKLSDFAGKEVVLIFWATWCPYCVKEVPHLNLLQSEMADKAVVLAISDESATTIKRFAARKKIRYHLAVADRAFSNMGSLYRQATSKGRPTGMHIDKNGKVKIIYIGSPTVTELKAIINADE